MGSSKVLCWYPNLQYLREGILFVNKYISNAIVKNKGYWLHLGPIAIWLMSFSFFFLFFLNGALIKRKNLEKIKKEKFSHSENALWRWRQSVGWYFYKPENVNGYQHDTKSFGRGTEHTRLQISQKKPILDLRFRPPRLWDDDCLLFLPSSLWYFILAVPEN